jgi:hypothetical protein
MGTAANQRVERPMTNWQGSRSGGGKGQEGATGPTAVGSVLNGKPLSVATNSRLRCANDRSALAHRYADIVLRVAPSAAIGTHNFRILRSRPSANEKAIAGYRRVYRRCCSVGRGLQAGVGNAAWLRIGARRVHNKIDGSCVHSTFVTARYACCARRKRKKYYWKHGAKQHKHQG